MATLYIFTAVSKRAALVAWLWQLMLERYVPSLYMAQLGDMLAGPSPQQDSSGVCGFGPCGKVSLTSAGVVQAFGGLRWYKHVGWLEFFKLLSVYPSWQTCPLLCYLGKESWPQDTHVLVQQVTCVAWLCQFVARVVPSLYMAFLWAWEAVPLLSEKEKVHPGPLCWSTTRRQARWLDPPAAPPVQIKAPSEFLIQLYFRSLPPPSAYRCY